MKKLLLLLTILAVSFGCLARASSPDFSESCFSGRFLSDFDAFLSQNNMGTRYNFSNKLLDLRDSDLEKLKNFFKSKGVDYNTWVNDCVHIRVGNSRVCKKMKIDDLNNWALNSQYYKNYFKLINFITQKYTFQYVGNYLDTFLARGLNTVIPILNSQFPAELIIEDDGFVQYFVELISSCKELNS